MIAPGASCSRQFPSKPSQLLQLAQQCLAYLIIRLVEDQAADHLINGVLSNFNLEPIDAADDPALFEGNDSDVARKFRERLRRIRNRSRRRVEKAAQQNYRRCRSTKKRRAPEHRAG